MKKRCTKCKEPKELEEFYRHKARRDGRSGWCKVCSKAYKRENLEKATAISRKWRKENPEKFRNTRLKRDYGITFDEYTKMLAAQKNCCAICGEAWGEGQCQPCVDHDHSKDGRKSVRGIIHGKCNLLLGYAEKHEELFGKINQYLERHSARR